MSEPIGDEYARGQMYTAPWETTNGVTVKWVPFSNNGITSAAEGEILSISVRFMKRIDETATSFVEERVAVESNPQVQSLWDSTALSGAFPEGTECPEVGYRDALPCDEDIDYVFDESLRKGDSYVSSLQGDPLSTLAEVTCHVDNASGQFTLTNDVLSDAIAYAKQNNAKGAIFYVSRTTKTEANIPNVRDSNGNLSEIGPLLLSSNAVQIGRFWFNNDNFQSLE